jgi:integrase
LPVRKYIKVWIKRRKNPPKMNGRQTTSLTLEWVEYGRRSFMSLGKGATMTYASAMAKAKETELNNPRQIESLKPITWKDFAEEYLDKTYPGYELPTKQRKQAAQGWRKSDSSRRTEQRVLKDFARIVKPDWCHDITSKDRESYIRQRLTEVPSPESVDADLRALRSIFNVLEEWKHIPEGSSPFAGKGNATIGTKRKRERDLKREKSPEYYTRKQVLDLLNQADKDVRENPDDWARRRLRALVYFEAYTGVRINEALHLEWHEIDLDTGVAHVNFKIEHGLKTKGSEAPVGLPDALLVVLRDWQSDQMCSFVFPNSRKKPWTGGVQGTKALDQLKDLARRAGIEHATWKMFRHTLTTHGKQWFGLTAEQMRLQLRHTTQDTQKHYEHTDLENLRDSVRQIDFRRDN